VEIEAEEADSVVVEVDLIPIQWTELKKQEL
jgi:hypothetical protein